MADDMNNPGEQGRERVDVNGWHEGASVMHAVASWDVGQREEAHRAATRRAAQALGMSSDYEVRTLCAALGCSYQQLRTAVAAVGPSFDLVQDYLAAEYLMHQ